MYLLEVLGTICFQVLGSDNRNDSATYNPAGSACASGNGVIGVQAGAIKCFGHGGLAMVVIHRCYRHSSFGRFEGDPGRVCRQMKLSIKFRKEERSKEKTVFF